MRRGSLSNIEGSGGGINLDTVNDNIARLYEIAAGNENFTGDVVMMGDGDPLIINGDVVII